MPKAGDSYQEIVGLVRNALDPGATVKVGAWMNGPDGRRDLDVEVRGNKEGSPHFVLVECKDWGRPVGIKEIDALESKKRDLMADAAIIYSNSGFTKPALDKAFRVGIGAASALKLADDRIKTVVYVKIYAEERIVDHYSVVLHGEESEIRKLPQVWQPEDLTYNGLPVKNWLSKLSDELLSDHFAPVIVSEYLFAKDEEFKISQVPVMIRGLRITLYCETRWLQQTVQQDVSIGHYDYHRKAIVIPHGEFGILGVIDNSAWRTSSPPNEDHVTGTEPPSGIELRFSLELTRPIAPIPELGTPNIDELEASCAVRTAEKSET